ncbi:MAG: cysteine--tRNA ligase, partial [Acholeplasmataceae bacterium]|nr:cysteine--tRNA ligase [Acholeplasmataceae bacterium]
MVRIYNSLTKQLEDFKPLKENEVSMYVCGPTVYDRMHIGNSRPVIFFDTVARFFRYLGYRITHVSNFTDIDDKIIARARHDQKSEEEISERYIKEIIKTYRRLNCLPHSANPKVTETMPEIISFIEVLLQKGGAYVVDGDVYFDITKVEDYGILSSQTVDNLISGARIEPNDKKHNPIDFTLWKETTEGRNWPSPWSLGRPGWHTECVVMIDKVFGGKIDIHGGGTDLKFPHHDNEIAQSVCAHDHHLANYWMHNGRIDFSGEKMSKSLGNVIWADDLLDRISHQVYRLLMLNVPYRQPMNYREELLEQATTDYEKIRRAYNGLYRKLEELPEEAIENSEIKALKAEFIAAMADDFNTANALTSIFKMVKLANGLVREKNPEPGLMKAALTLFSEMLWVFGIETGISPLSDEQKALLEQYREARK